MKLKLGISTCPNDIFIFYAIIEKKIDFQGLEFEISFLDVQELNERLFKGLLDFSKSSFHAAFHLSDRYGVMKSGAALGFGAGPILLSAKGKQTLKSDSIVLCPGEWTTATLLFRIIHPEILNLRQILFSNIMPALKKREADFGVVIHEGRFVYKREGLHLREDLGETYEKRTHLPIPLGGIVGRLDLPRQIHNTFQQILRNSIQYAMNHRDETFPTLQHFAQELEPDVIWKHVELYVNEFTFDLENTGIKAIKTLEETARQNGIIPQNTPSLIIL